ncbi:MAG: hypothetical protein ABIA08_02270 [bacterium]
MTKELYPAAFEDEGGVSIPHIPTDEEMANCVFAKRTDTKCPGGNCSACLCHPWRSVAGGTRTRPKYNEILGQQNKSQGMHRRRIKAG